MQKQCFGKYLKFLKIEQGLRQTYHLDSWLEVNSNLIEKQIKSKEKISNCRKFLAFIKGQSMMSCIFKNGCCMTGDEVLFNSNYNKYKKKMKNDLDLTRLIKVLDNLQESSIVSESDIPETEYIKKSAGVLSHHGNVAFDKKSLATLQQL